MGKKVSTKTNKKKKKSWWTFFFFFAIAAVISVPVAARITFPEYSTGEVAGISSTASGSGEFKDKKPCPIVTTGSNITPKPCGPNEGRKPKPSVYLTSVTLTRDTVCFPGFKSASYTCSDGTSSTVTLKNASCESAEAIIKLAEKACIKLGVSVTPSATQKTTGMSKYMQLFKSNSGSSNTR